MKYEIRDVVSDYGIYENGELKLILNSRANAEYIKAILEVDASRSNEAMVNVPECGIKNDDDLELTMYICSRNSEFCPDFCSLKNDSNCNYTLLSHALALIRRQKNIIRRLNILLKRGVRFND